MYIYDDADCMSSCWIGWVSLYSHFREGGQAFCMLLFNVMDRGSVPEEKKKKNYIEIFI